MLQKPYDGGRSSSCLFIILDVSLEWLYLSHILFIVVGTERNSLGPEDFRCLED